LFIDKTSKSSKGTTPICLSYGEVSKIKGTDVEQTGEGELLSQCNVASMMWNSDDCAHYEEPWVVNRDTGTTTTFVYDDGTKYGFGLTPETEAPLGEGALCGSIGATHTVRPVLPTKE